MAKDGAARYVGVSIDYVAGISARAIMVGYEGRELWIPKSVIFIDDVPEKRVDEPTQINVQDWFAKKEGLVG